MRENYTYFPKWIEKNVVMYGVLALIVPTLLFSSRAMPLYLYAVILLEIVGFCYYSWFFSHKWDHASVKLFCQRVFWIGVLLRIPFTLYYHILNLNTYGHLYCFYLSDVNVYVGLPYQAVESILSRGNWLFISEFLKYLMIDDLGAPVLNTILLLCTANVSPCGVPLIANVLMGAYTSVFIYKIARRHFGEDVARIAAIFCMLNPNMIWWCSSLFKETQMLFFTCWFLERMDNVLQNKNISATNVVPVVMIGMFVFFYRAALGILLFLAFFIAVVFASNRVVSSGKKLLIGVLVVLLVLLSFGNSMIEQTNALTKSVTQGGQQANMEWRSTREHGNQFAKYAGAAVFAPLIFTIPFPTVTYTHESQEMLMEVAGGNFIKNIFSFLVVLCLLIVASTGEWRKHLFLIAYLFGYLVILVLSPYAQSGRFHIPAIPFEMMFAAYCIKLINENQKIFGRIGSRIKYKRWFNCWCILMFIACVGWQWFKLRGQGLI